MFAKAICGPALGMSGQALGGLSGAPKQARAAAGRGSAVSGPVSHPSQPVKRLSFVTGKRLSFVTGKRLSCRLGENQFDFIDTRRSE